MCDRRGLATACAGDVAVVFCSWAQASAGASMLVAASVALAFTALALADTQAGDAAGATALRAF